MMRLCLNDVCERSVNVFVSDTYSVNQPLVSNGELRLGKDRTFLHGLVSFAIGVLFRLLPVGQVAFAVAYYISHMTKIILIIIG